MIIRTARDVSMLISGMGRITLKSNDYNYNYFQKLQLQLQLQNTFFSKVMITIIITLGK